MIRNFSLSLLILSIACVRVGFDDQALGGGDFVGGDSLGVGGDGSGGGDESGGDETTEGDPGTPDPGPDPVCGPRSASAIYHSTVNSAAAVATPEIGGPSVARGGSFVEGICVDGLLVDALGEVIEVEFADGMSNRNISFAQGSLEFWFRPLWNAADNENHQFFAPADLLAQGGLVIIKNDDLLDNTFDVSVRDATGIIVGTQRVAAVNLPFESGVWVHVAISWELNLSLGAQSVRIFFNDVEPDYQILVTAPADMRPSSSSESFFVGAFDVDESSTADGVIDDLVVYSQPRPPVAPGGCFSAGAGCADDSVFIGAHPALDRVGLFVPNNDQSADVAWGTLTDTGAESNGDGRANQVDIVNNFPPLSDFPAFELCEELVIHGHSDWYLPSPQELNVLYTNAAAVDLGSEDPLNDTPYWTSQESAAPDAFRIDFNDGMTLTAGKQTTGASVRCVRRASLPPMGG